MRVADYIFNRLQSLGIGKAYIVTGRGALFLTDGLAKNGSFDVICTHPVSYTHLTLPTNREV